MKVDARPGGARSAPAAYREDVRTRGGEPFGNADSGWVLVASLVDHAALQEEPTARRDAVVEASTIASRLLAECDRTAGADASPAAAVGDPLERLAEQMEEAGALVLAALLLDGYGVVAEMTDTRRGELLSHRARIAWKAADLDGAETRYEAVAALGKRDLSGELACRALVGQAIVARLRGNHPKARIVAQRALRAAQKTGQRPLLLLARHVRMTGAATAHRFDEALVHGWELYRLSVGDPIAECDALLNIGQVLLDIGHVREARAALGAVLVRNPPARVALPALGGYAIASAALSNRRAVDFAAREIERGAAQANLPYQAGFALLEGAEALARAGHFLRARSFLKRATEVAQRHGYHELAFRVEALALEAAPKPKKSLQLSATAARAAKHLAHLDPGGALDGLSLFAETPT